MPANGKRDAAGGRSGEARTGAAAGRAFPERAPRHAQGFHEAGELGGVLAAGELAADFPPRGPGEHPAQRDFHRFGGLAFEQAQVEERQRLSVPGRGVAPQPVAQLPGGLQAVCAAGVQQRPDGRQGLVGDPGAVGGAGCRRSTSAGRSGSLLIWITTGRTGAPGARGPGKSAASSCRAVTAPKFSK